MIKGLDYAWEHARDQAGLMYHDWTGRTDENVSRNGYWMLRVYRSIMHVWR